jgi:2-oxoglutarate ferredoxin oxidoreductase subunit alpha
VRRLCDKVNLYADEIVQVEERYLDDAEVAVFAYGSVARSAAQAVEEARAEGKRVGLLRPLTLWPFSDKHVARLAERVRCIVVAEMNLGQMVYEVRRASEGRCEVVSVNRIDGLMLEPREVVARLKEVL